MGELPNKHVVDHPDAYLNVLLDYTGGFYGAAREAGLPAKTCADAMQHVESAARGLHRKANEAASRIAELEALLDEAGKALEGTQEPLSRLDHHDSEMFKDEIEAVSQALASIQARTVADRLEGEG